MRPNWPGLRPCHRRLVKPPRVAASPVALECKYMQTVDLPPSDGVVNAVVFGQVIGVHIDDSVIEDGMVDVARFKPIARLGYHDYAVVDELFSMRAAGVKACRLTVEATDRQTRRVPPGQ